MNNVAFIQDEIELPSGTDVTLVLPQETFSNTIVLREDEERVRNYRIRHEVDRTLVQWQAADDAEGVRVVTITYLMRGLSWIPHYDMWLTESDETVGFDFFAEFTNSVMPLEDVTVNLVAGRVDTQQQIEDVSRITTNQYIAGYTEAGASSQPLTGDVTIQHIYEIGSIFRTTF